MKKIASLLVLCLFVLGIANAQMMRRDTVKFVSVPPTSARADSMFTYQAKAVSSNSTAKIQYALDRSIGTMGGGLEQPQITPDGLLTWMHPAKGWINIKILAISDKGGNASQEFQLVVAGANGILMGSVTDTMGKALSPVVIEVFEVFKKDPSSCFRYSTITDKNGNYRINHLDTGSYIIAATPLLPNYLGQWYLGKKNALEATVVLVQDSSKSIPAIANFKLLSRDAVVSTLTVKGSVGDTLGHPIAAKKANVFFVRTDFALNSGNLNKDTTTVDDFRRFFDFDHAMDFRLTGGSQHVFKADVDSTGAFKLTLPRGSYIAFARAAGYATQFYRGHDDLLSADVLNLTVDSLGIDFTLATLPPIVLGDISGTVSDTANNAGVRARVIAFRDHWNYTEQYAVARNHVTDTDTLGHYTLSDLPPGWYIVLAVPVGNYAPAFYNSGTQTIGWQKATRIHVTGNSITDINIYTHPMNRSTGGIAGIGGHVGGKGGQNATAGISGAMIVALTSTGDIAGYGFSDAAGNYLINNLAPGTYSVMLDKPGYSTSGAVSASPTYSTTGRPVISTVSFTASEVTAVVAQQSSVLPATYTLEQNYPNPFNPTTTIRYALPASGLVTLKIYNLLGQEVMTLVNAQQTAGSFQVNFDAGQLASGVYVYQLHAGSTVATKKMTLLK